ncbi:MAG TPA: SH3 domain-containing protein [Gemmatimonadaceae bacterium]
MRSVRCEVCGTKALTAASKCPRCGHLFDVRDGFGELLPLAYCSTCDSYYPETVGLCKWCGTKPETSKIPPAVWKGVGAGAVVVILFVGFLLRDSGPKRDAEAQTTADAKSKVEATSQVASTPADTSIPEMKLVKVDSIPRDDETPSTNANGASRATTAPGPEPRPAGSSSSMAEKPIPRPAASPSTIEKPTTSVAPPAARTTSPARKATPTAKTRSATRWVSSVAREWVIVRAGPSRSSRLVASIGPNSRVQLGEVRGSWRRIRMRGITGWVETSSEFASIPTPPARFLVTR